MAITERRRIIANPARRRMSTKQRAYFGSARARAAARERLRAGGSKSHRNRQRNPGEIIGYTLANPARRKGNMARTKANRRKQNRRRVTNRRHNTARSHHRTHHYGGHHRRRNAGRRHNAGRRMNYHRRHHRHNPGRMGRLTDIFTNAIFVLIGALGSKLGAQLFLGANNVSWMGYAANAAVGVGLWWITETVMKNPEASKGIISGTVVEIILRILNDMTPFGQYVSGLGMGDYQMQSFVTPQVLVDPYNSAQIAIPPGWAPTTMIAPPPSTTGTTGPAAGAGVGPAAAAGMGSPYGNAYDAYSTYGH